MPKIILRQTEPEVLYTYPYDSFNTGQDVSYAIGDDKDIRDTVFAPEIASWDTSLVWSFPVLDETDPTKLLRGSNPDGSGTNIFGNLERFTDELGTQVYANGLYLDHAYGSLIQIQQNQDNWQNQISSVTNNYHVANLKEYQSLYNISTGFLAYPPFNLTVVGNTFTSPFNFLSSSTVKRDANNMYLIVQGVTQTIEAAPESADFTVIGKRKSLPYRCLLFKKAFTYNSSTKKMDFSL